MRVTDNAAARQYLYNNNKSMSTYLNCFNRVLSQKDFLRASENSVSANRAMKIRKNLNNLTMYDSNLKQASELFTSAESNLYHIANDVYLNVDAKLTSVQDTKNTDELQAIAAEIEESAKEMMSSMNSDFSGRQIFAGTSNNKTPFTVKYFEPDGTEVAEADKSGEAKAVVYFNDDPINQYNDASKFNGCQTGIYVDVGLGVKYNQDANGNVTVDKDTVMDVSLNGAKLTGCGTDGLDPADSNNIIQLTFDAAYAVRNGDLESANRLIDKLQKAQTTVLEGITRMGATQNKIDFYLNKNEDYRYNLSEDQNETEGVQIEKEITNMTAAQAAYNAALQLGARAIPQSIFSYI